MVQTEWLSTDAAGWEISPSIEHQNAAKQTVRRPQKGKEKALKPSGFKAFPVAGAEGLEVASQPLLRGPKKSSGCRISSIFSTAAPTPARCIRHRRREQAPRSRCPKRLPLAFARAVSTAAPTPARCIRHRRRSQALPGTRFWSGCREKKNHQYSALSRRLPPAKIVFDAVLMLYDLAGVCVKYKTASSYILLSCIEG